MNTTNNTTNANNKTKGEKSMFKKLAEEKTSLLYLIMIIAMLSFLTFLSPIFCACFVLLLLTAGAMRITFYLSKTKKNGFKRSVVGFVESIYTQNDFENFRHGLTEELYKEMKNNAYVEISTEKQELEKERAKMKEFLRKHNTGGVVFSQFEKDMFADVALYVGRCFSDYMWEYTLQDFVNFFNRNREDFIKSIQDEAFRGCMLNDMTKSLTFYCLNKKALRELRKKLRDAYGNSDKCKKIVICDDYRKNEQGFTEKFVQHGHILDGYNI